MRRRKRWTSGVPGAKPVTSDRASFAVMRYGDSGRTAAVANDGSRRTFVAGFPFETIRSEEQRERLMGDVLRFLTQGRRVGAAE